LVLDVRHPRASSPGRRNPILPGLSPWVGRGLVVLLQGVVDIVKILVTGKVLTDLAKLEPNQVERLQDRLERVRPPPPDELEPPATTSVDPSVGPVVSPWASSSTNLQVDGLID
jgi:hypothetical protein